jgi:hypothetical protein
MESSLLENKKYYNLSEPQKMVFMSEIYYPDTSLSTICVSNDLGSHIDTELLRKAINCIIYNNEGLRIRITVINGIPLQYISENNEYIVNIHDFRKSDKINEEEWLQTKINYKFTLLNSTLFSFDLYYSYDNTLKLLITTHHIISDAWSHQSLSTQIYKIYESYSNDSLD